MKIPFTNYKTSSHAPFFKPRPKTDKSEISAPANPEYKGGAAERPLGGINWFQNRNPPHERASIPAGPGAALPQAGHAPADPTVTTPPSTLRERPETPTRPDSREEHRRPASLDHATMDTSRSDSRPVMSGTVPWLHGGAASGSVSEPTGTVLDKGKRVQFGPVMIEGKEAALEHRRTDKAAHRPGSPETSDVPYNFYEKIKAGERPVPNAPAPGTDGVKIHHDAQTPKPIKDFWDMADPLIDAQMKSGKSLWEIVESRDFKMLERQFDRVAGLGFDDPQLPLPPGHEHLMRGKDQAHSGRTGEGPSIAGPSGTQASPTHSHGPSTSAKKDADTGLDNPLKPTDSTVARELWREQRKQWKTDNFRGGDARGGGKW